MHTVEERVDSLERVLEKFITSVNNSQMRTEAELREFKDEMRQQTREMNVKWGEMANKMGTIVEDLVTPSIPRIVNEEFGLETEFIGIRIKKRLKDGSVKEYDTIAVADGYVFVNSTKSTLRTPDIEKFIEEIKGFREVFPEYKKSKIIGMLTSLYADKSVIRHAEKVGFLVLSVGDKLMEVKNTKGFNPKEW